MCNVELDTAADHRSSSDGKMTFIMGIHGELYTFRTGKAYRLPNKLLLSPINDMPLLGLKIGQMLEVELDGEHLRAGELTWGRQQLAHEIAQGVWFFGVPSKDLRKRWWVKIGGIVAAATVVAMAAWAVLKDG